MSLAATAVRDTPFILNWTALLSNSNIKRYRLSILAKPVIPIWRDHVSSWAKLTSTRRLKRTTHFCPDASAKYSDGPWLYILCFENMFISRVAEVLYLQRIEKIDRFQDGSNSHKDYLPAFKKEEINVKRVDRLAHNSPQPFIRQLKPLIKFASRPYTRCETIPHL
jgi:hypothetical protein